MATRERETRDRGDTTDVLGRPCNKSKSYTEQARFKPATRNFKLVHWGSKQASTHGPAVHSASVEKWAVAQPDRPTLSEAIPRLVELGLRAKK